ncbi:MAG: thioredoxin [Deltaproteobacteria bacterium]|nr:thioredoxin [Deltaproteobacteria bacterium]
MSGNVVHVSQADFDTVVLQSDVPVLVDFWAVWCGPCKAVAPLVQSMAETFGSSLKVCKVDVDNAMQVAMRYGIRSIPTLLLFKGGKVVGQRVGALPRDRLEAFVREAF